MPSRFAGPRPCGSSPAKRTFTAPLSSAICRSMYFWRRATRSSLVISRLDFTDNDRCGTQQFVPDRVPFLDDGDNRAVLRWIADRRHGDRFVARRVERLSNRIEARDAESLELGEELIAHETNTGQQCGIRRPRRCGADRAIEIVEDVEELGDRGSYARIDIARRVAAQPRLHLLELVERAA